MRIILCYTHVGGCHKFFSRLPTAIFNGYINVNLKL